MSHSSGFFAVFPRPTGCCDFTNLIVVRDQNLKDSARGQIITFILPMRVDKVIVLEQYIGDFFTLLLTNCKV